MLQTYFHKDLIEVGLDEAGRGCLAGPVVAAAVILPKDYNHPLLNDSKKISEKNRDILREEIMKNAIAYGIASASPKEIDQINILNASFLAMHRAIDSLNQPAELLLVDGNRFKPYKNIPHECIVKGDGKFTSIAAASILAKTERDAIMRAYAQEYPLYDWEKNAGYPTKFHREAIQKHGITPIHRKSYGPVANQLELPFNQ